MDVVLVQRSVRQLCGSYGDDGACVVFPVVPEIVNCATQVLCERGGYRFD